MLAGEIIVRGRPYCEVGLVFVGGVESGRRVRARPLVFAIKARRADPHTIDLD